MITDHRIFYKDARDMREIQAGSVRLTVTSPPYPMIEMWDDLFCSISPDVRAALDAGDGRQAHEQMHAVLDIVWRAVDRATAPSGIVCINIGDATRAIGGTFRMYNNYARIARFFYEAGYDELPSILWLKQSNKPNKFMGSGMLPPNAYVTQEHERICIFRKGGIRAFSFEDAAERRRSGYFWEERNLWFSDIWGDLKGVQQRLDNVRPRSAAFPLEVPYRLINMYSVMGDRVLDPFLGTGTTAFAASVAGRSSSGYEIDAGMRPVIAARMAGLGELSKTMVKERLARHVAFVSSRARDRGSAARVGGSAGYRSEAYGFPVVTAQETGIVLPVISEIKPAKDKWLIKYDP